MKLYITLLGSLLAIGSMSGCVPVAVGAVAGSAAYVTTQDRSAGQAVDDTNVWLKIKNLYTQQNVNDLLMHVNVEVHQGRVLLTGYVLKPETRVHAVKLAQGVAGVKEVINEISVESHTASRSYASDTWITGQVKSKIILEKDIRASNYNVHTVDGTVYLLGVAQSERELRIVTELASKIKGVKKVVSHVKIVGH